MHPSHALASLVVLGCFAVSAPAASDPGTHAAPDRPASIDWRTDADVAFAEARETGRPVLVDVYADWCQPCLIMERDTYGDPAVIEATAKVVPLKIDTEVDEELANRYLVKTLPSTLVLEPNGRVVVTVSGLLGAEDMVELIDRVVSGWDAYLDDVARPADPAAVERVARYLAGIGNAEGAVRALKVAVMVSRNGGASPEQVQRLEVLAADAMLADDDLTTARAEFDRLARDGATREIRGQALRGQVQVALRSGRRAEAERLLERLRTEHPEIAERWDAR